MRLNTQEMLERNKSYYILSPEEISNGRSTHWPELELSGTIRNLSPALWKLNHLTALYINDNCLFRLPSSVGLLQNLRRLDLSNNQLRSLPAEIGELVELRELMLNNNGLRLLPYELGKLFQMQILGLKGNPLGHDVLALHSEHDGTKKLLEFMLDNLHVTASPPPPRPWIQTGAASAILDKSRPAAIFTVMCYNVLCDKYATRQMYGYCPQWALSWEYRKKGILDEIKHYGADVITLQEVETSQFYAFFLPELKREGYEGLFAPKSRAKTMQQETERGYVDGCAIFYRASKFQLREKKVIEFSQLAMAHAEGSDLMLNRVMTKDNIALALLLETKESCWERVGGGAVAIQQPPSLMVATAHIHWDPEFCDVKLIQTLMLMDQLRQFKEDAASALSLRPGGESAAHQDVQLLLTGDFNSLPTSGVVQFLETGRVPIDHPEFKDLGYREVLRKMLHGQHAGAGAGKFSGHARGDDKTYAHAFRLASAFTTDILPYTNYTYDFKGMIDYVFYPAATMRPLGVMGPISPEWLGEHRVVGCPHPHITSDHFSLLVELGMQYPLPVGGGGGAMAGRNNLTSALAAAAKHLKPQLPPR